MDSGVERVEDDPSRRALQQRARVISAKSLVVGVLLAAIATALPVG
jgi:hypothetical protein